MSPLEFAQGGFTWEWGVCDCTLFCASWVFVETGKDPGEGLRSTYSTAAEANAIVDRAGGMEVFIGQRLEGCGFARCIEGARRAPARARPACSVRSCERSGSGGSTPACGQAFGETGLPRMADRALEVSGGQFHPVTDLSLFATPRGANRLTPPRERQTSSDASVVQNPSFAVSPAVTG